MSPVQGICRRGSERAAFVESRCIQSHAGAARSGAQLLHGRNAVHALQACKLRPVSGLGGCMHICGCSRYTRCHAGTSDRWEFSARGTVWKRAVGRWNGEAGLCVHVRQRVPQVLPRHGSVCWPGAAPCTLMPATSCRRSASTLPTEASLPHTLASQPRQPTPGVPGWVHRGPPQTG